MKNTAETKANTGHEIPCLWRSSTSCRSNSVLFIVKLLEPISIRALEATFICNTSFCSFVPWRSRHKTHIPLNSNSGSHPFPTQLFLFSISYTFNFYWLFPEIFLDAQVASILKNRTKKLPKSLHSHHTIIPFPSALGLTKHFSTLSLVAPLSFTGLSLTYKETVQTGKGGPLPPRGGSCRVQELEHWISSSSAGSLCSRRTPPTHTHCNPVWLQLFPLGSYQLTLIGSSLKLLLE